MAKKKQKLFNSWKEWGQMEKGTFTTSNDKTMSGGPRTTPWYKRKKAGTKRRKG